MDIALETELSDLISYLASINELDADSLTDEIVELRDNLVELIELKKEELLECKKSILLQKFDLQIQEESGDKSDAEDDIVGSTRSINFRYLNGSSGRRNIVIYDSVRTDNGLYHTCFFLHPIYQCELPCQMFLNNVECAYKQSCKFSHGELTAASDIGDAVVLEPVAEASKCLTQIDVGGVWSRCTVLHIDDAANSCVVQLDASVRGEKVINVDLDRVARYRDSDERCAESDDDCEIVSDDCQIIGDNYSAAVGNGVASTFGAWERHTRGIGMRLLLQMGYQRDRGLGKNQQGRLEPVEVAPAALKRSKSAAAVSAIDRRASQRPVEQKCGGSVRENAKATLARNDAKMRRLQSAVVALQRSKERHSSSQSLTTTADKRIGEMRHKMAELRAADKRLGKQLDKQSDKRAGGKLKIF